MLDKIFIRPLTRMPLRCRLYCMSAAGILFILIPMIPTVSVICIHSPTYFFFFFFAGISRGQRSVSGRND